MDRLVEVWMKKVTGWSFFIFAKMSVFPTFLIE